MNRLRISDNRRYIQHADGRPFFYLADTAWELFHVLNREEAVRYLRNRADKGFTAIQAVVLGELDGLGEPNAYGHLPLTDKDPTKPNEAYFEHVDFIVREANKMGLFIAMLPTWGAWVVNQPIFTAENARKYGQFLGKRYKDADIIWVLGGDRPGEGLLELWGSMAKGLMEGDGNTHVRTFHPCGGGSSTRWVHNEDWLDFNMIQSGHGRPYQTNWRMVDADYAMTPVKPTLDGEPCYENHPIGFNRKNPKFTEHHVRCASYWSVFHGGCGITYGCHDIWMMHKPGRLNGSFSFNYWYEVLDLPATYHMQHLRRLMESRPYFTRIPDQSILVGNSQLSDHRPCTRDGTPGNKDATYIMVYTPLHGKPTVDTSVIAGSRLNAWWYDPRTGQATAALTNVPNEGGKLGVETPDHPQYDWVLVIDDASKNYPAPGTVKS